MSEALFDRPVGRRGNDEIGGKDQGETERGTLEEFGEGSAGEIR